MKVADLIKITSGKLLTPGVDLTREIKGGCGADLMSDVLASIQPEAVLLTGLCNPQVVRTAQMADVAQQSSLCAQKIHRKRPSIWQYKNRFHSFRPHTACSSYVAGFTKMECQVLKCQWTTALATVIESTNS